MFLQCSTCQLVAQVSFVNLPACLFRMLSDSRTGQRIGPGEPSVACTGTGPYPACGVQDRTLILTTSHLGLDPIPHVPGTGPNPHYWAYSTTTRTRQTTTTIPFGLCLGQSSIAAARSIPGRCVCVCTRLDMATVREQGGKGSSDKPCPTGVDHHCAPAFGLASGPPAALE